MDDNLINQGSKAAANTKASLQTRSARCQGFVLSLGLAMNAIRSRWRGTMFSIGHIAAIRVPLRIHTTLHYLGIVTSRGSLPAS